jgi:hypothetical protein
VWWWWWHSIACFACTYVRTNNTTNVHHCSHPTRIQHDADASANGLRWQIALEAAPDDAVRPVMPAHLAPIDTECAGAGAAVVTIGGLGNERDALAEVKFGAGLVVGAANFDERDNIFLVAEAALVAQNGAIDMQTG